MLSARMATMGRAGSCLGRYYSALDPRTIIWRRQSRCVRERQGIGTSWRDLASGTSAGPNAVALG